MSQFETELEGAWYKMYLKIKYCHLIYINVIGSKKQYISILLYLSTQCIFEKKILTFKKKNMNDLRLKWIDIYMKI